MTPRIPVNFFRPDGWAGGLSELLAAVLPAATEADPEGEQDEPEVEPEGLPAEIEEVVAELLAPRDIPVGVDLGQAGQPGSGEVALAIARDRLQRNQLAAAVDL